MNNEERSVRVLEGYTSYPFAARRHAFWAEALSAFSLSEGERWICTSDLEGAASSTSFHSCVLRKTNGESIG